MGQLSQFITHHWELWLLLVGVLLLIGINEFLEQRKQAKTLSPTAAVLKINHDDAVVIDLREAEPFKAGHIIDSIRISADDVKQKHLDKYKKKPIILVCARGTQSATVAASLRTEGFAEPLVLAGGIAAWHAANLPLVKGKN